MHVSLAEPTRRTTEMPVERPLFKLTVARDIEFVVEAKAEGLDLRYIDNPSNRAVPKLTFSYNLQHPRCTRNGTRIFIHGTG